MFLSLFVLWTLALAAPDPAPSPAVRRLAVLLPDGWAATELARWASFAKRQGIDIRVGAPPAASADWEVVRLAAIPASEAFRQRLAVFGVAADRDGFSFDGRVYRGSGDASLLSHPERLLETLVLGTSREAATRMLRRIIRGDGGLAGRDWMNVV